MTLMKQEVCWAHGYLDMVTADITPGQLGWIPPGIANPAAATQAHGELSCLKGLQGAKGYPFLGMNPQPSGVGFADRKVTGASAERTHFRPCPLKWNAPHLNPEVAACSPIC